MGFDARTPSRRDPGRLRTAHALQTLPSPRAHVQPCAKRLEKGPPWSDTAAHRAGPAWGKIAVIAVVVVALAAIWRYTPLADYLTAERIIGWAERVRAVPWAPLAVMFVYVPASFLMFPRPLITLFAVMAFGPWLGFTYAMTGVMLASIVTYYVGRALPRDTVRHIVGDKLNRVSAVLRRRGLLAVFAMRIVPVAPHPVVGIVCGAIRIKLWHFAAGTFLGMAPGTLTTTVFGDQFQAALEDPSKINYWLVAARRCCSAWESFSCAAGS